MVLHDADRLISVGCGEQLHAVVLELLERLLDQQPDVLLVVDDEDGWHRVGSLAVMAVSRGAAIGAHHDGGNASDTQPRVGPAR